MKKTRKLILSRETLRDLTAQNGGEIRGGGKGGARPTKGKNCPTGGCTGYCTVTCNTCLCTVGPCSLICSW